MNRFLFCVLGLVALMVSCTSSIVRKPEINAVRKVAIVSLFATEDVLYKHGSGKYDSWQGSTKDRVAQMGHQAFEEEFKKLGWELTPYQKVVASAPYQKYFGRTEIKGDSNLLQKGVAIAQRIHNNQYFTLPKMSPIHWFKELENRQTASFDLANFSVTAQKPFNERMQEVANDLGVDAVAAIHLDYCYGDGTSVLGQGEAYILGQGSMYAVDKRGVDVVKLPKMEKRCETDKFGGKSTNSTVLIGGKLVFGDKLNQDKLISMFYQATQQTARKIVRGLDEAIHEK